MIVSGLSFTATDVDMVKTVGGMLLTAVGASMTFAVTELRRASKRRRDQEQLRGEQITRAEAILSTVTTLSTTTEELTRSVRAVERTVEAVETTVKRVANEVIINGGKITVATVVGELRDGLQSLTIAKQLDTAARRMGESKAIWEGHIGADGELTLCSVSEEWVHLTGLERDDAAAGGWMRCIATVDRERVLQAAAASAARRGYFECEYTCVNIRTRKATRVCHTGKPEFLHGQLIGWVGLLTPLPYGTANA